MGGWKPAVQFAAPSAVHALLKRIRQRLPLARGGVSVGFRLAAPLDTLKPDVVYEIILPANQGVVFLAGAARA